MAPLSPPHPVPTCQGQQQDGQALASLPEQPVSLIPQSAPQVPVPARRVPVPPHIPLCQGKPGWGELHQPSQGSSWPCLSFPALGRAGVAGQAGTVPGTWPCLSRQHSLESGSEGRLFFLALGSGFPALSFFPGCLPGSRQRHPGPLLRLQPEPGTAAWGAGEPPERAWGCHRGCVCLGDPCATSTLSL